MRNKIMLMLFLLVLIVGTVSAFEWDNVKQYNEDTKTVTVVNALGLGDDIATITLKSPTKKVMAGTHDNFFEIEINNFGLYSDVVSKMEYYKLRNNIIGNEIEKSNYWVFYDTKKEKTIVSYEDVCNGFHKNGTTNCYEERIETLGYGDWVSFDNTKTLPIGKVKLRNYIEIKEFEWIEYVPSFYGVKVSEWAGVGNDGYTTLLLHLDGTDGGTSFPDSAIGNTSTHTFSAVADAHTNTTIKKFGTGSLLCDGTGDYIQQVEQDSIDVNLTNGIDFTLDFWTYVQDDGADRDAVNIRSLDTSNSDVRVIVRADEKVRILLNGADDLTSNTSLNLNQWNHIVVVRNGTDLMVFQNGFVTIKAVSTRSSGGGTGRKIVLCSIVDGAFSQWYTGYIDEVRYSQGIARWISDFTPPTAPYGQELIISVVSPANTTYTDSTIFFNATVNAVVDTWIVNYNGTNQTLTDINTSLTVEDGAHQLLMYGNDTAGDFGLNDSVYFIVDTSPVISVYSPLNQSYDTSTVYFNMSADRAVDTWILDYNGTNITVTANNSLTVEDGAHQLLMYGNNSVGIFGLNDSVYFVVDTTAPQFDNILPVNATVILTESLPYLTNFNATITDNIALSACWYNNGTGNNTVTCGDNSTINLSAGWTTLIWYANDTVGNENSSSTMVFINYVIESINSSATALEGANTTVWFNLTATNITTLIANVSYNGTIYSMSEVSNNGTYAVLTRNVTVPLVNSDTNVNISVNYFLNGAIGNTSNNNQLIYNITGLVVSGACDDKAINFTLLDEANLSAINGTFDYNFLYGTSENSSFIRTFGTVASHHNWYVCINSTVSNNWILGEGQIFYNAPDYVDRRYYLFDGLVLTNNTNDIVLYDLFADDQTSFKLEIESTGLAPYDNIFTSLIRWYPDLNEYNVVDMGLTDETGATVIHVRTEDVDYRIGVYERNGTLIQLADPIRMVCLVSPCTYTLTVSPGDTDYTSFLNIEYDFDYDTTTGIWTFTFSDSTQLTSEMNLTVYRMTGTSVYPVCTSSVTAYSGAITCNTSIYSGNLKGVVKRSASPPITIVEKIITVATSAFSSQFGLWVSLLIALPILFIFAFMTPLGAVIGGVIALIPALYLGAINWAILGAITVLAGIVLHFLRRTSNK